MEIRWKHLGIFLTDAIRGHKEVRETIRTQNQIHLEGYGKGPHKDIGAVANLNSQ